MIFNQIISFDDKEHETLIGIWWSGLMLKQQARKFFKHYTVSETQFNVLMVLKYASGPLTQQQLSERLLVDNSNLTGLIERMEKTGFVEKKKDSRDYRCYCITLSQSGKDFLNEVEGPYREFVHKIMSVFNDKEKSRLIENMVRLQRELGEE